MASWQHWEAKYNETSLRDRALLIGALLLVFLLLCYQYGFAPLYQKTERMTQRTQELQNQITVLEQQKMGLVALHSRDPNANEKQQIQQSQSNIAQLDTQLQQKTMALITPEQMLAVLRQTLSSQQHVTLVELKSLASQPMLQQADEGKQSVNLYKHRVQLVIRGDYFAVVDYLRQLEQLPWTFYWESLDYQVIDYPNNQITIQIYTLSTEEVWIRV